MNKARNNKQRLGILIVALVVVAALALNVFLWILPANRTQKDMTEGQFYKISDEVKTFLSELDEEITLYLIDADGADEKFVYFIEKIADESDKITLKKMKLEDSEDLLREWELSVESLASSGYCLIAESEKRTEIVDYSSLFYYAVTNSTLNSAGIYTLSVSEYLYYASYFGQDEQYEQYLSYLVNESYRYFQGETVIASMLEYVVADIIPVHYVVTGHGERSFASSALEEIYTYYGSSYKTLDLRSVKAIPTDASTLLILAPETDYSEADVDMLKEYLSRGGQITVLTDEENLSMPNLMSLMASYGMTATVGAVGEKLTVEVDEDEDGGTEEKTEFSDSVTVTVNTGHDALSALDQLSGIPAPAITGGNAIVLDSSEEASLLLTPLLTTSENAYIGEATDALDTRILAAAAETADGAHLLWFTGADSYTVLAEEITESDDPRLSNNFCVYMSLNWTNIAYESQLEFPDAILYDAGYLQAVNSDAVGFGLLMIFLLPAAVIVCGVIVIYQRKKRN